MGKIVENSCYIDQLHADARAFLLSHGFEFEGDFRETHEKEVIKFQTQAGSKKIKCWLKCCYPEKSNSQGFCITFGAYSSTMPAHVTKTFWTDSKFQLTERDREAINERLALGRQQAIEREKHDKRVADDLASWCLERYQNASPVGFNPYFDRKGVKPYDIRFEIRRSYDEGIPTEETVALIPLRDINGSIRALEEIYPSKRKFHPDAEPRDKNTLGKYAGCFFTFGEIIDGKRIQLSEGYATAASLFLSNNHTSLMVVTRTNILNVAKAINQKYPNSEIVICGDDDVETKGNPGRADAIAAANHINAAISVNQPKCQVLFPQFPEDKNLDENGKAYTDFNDLMRICGIEEVKRQLNVPQSIPDQLQEPAKPQEWEEAEIEDDAGDGNLRQAKASARRRALMYRQLQEEIVRGICKQYPPLRDQAASIASNAIEWAKKYQIGNRVIVNGIPKKITDMKALDQQFAQLEAPGKPCITILREFAQPITDQDFKKRLSGDVVLTGVDNKGQPQYISAWAYWTGNTHKHIYRKVVFTNKPVSNDSYNLFTGFGVKPQPGKCDKILTHIEEVICSGNTDNYKAYINLNAWQIQNIGVASRVIVGLKSLEHQIGKGTLLEDIMLGIYGRAGFKTSNTEHILGRFNDALLGKVFVFLDEALFGGHRDKADAIKSLVTTSVLSIESKGLPIVQFPCAINLYIATNNDDAIHLDEADARYWILEVSPHRKGDTQYFNELYSEINNGGREAFLHYLLNLDVSNFVPKRDIQLNNAAKEAMIRNSINPFDARKWLEECCRAEMILGYKPIIESHSPWEPWQKGQEYPNGIFNTAYTEWQKTVKSPVAAKPTSGNKFGELLNKAGLDQRVDGKRLRTLPDPKECLETVIRMIERGAKK